MDDVEKQTEQKLTDLIYERQETDKISSQ